MEEKENSGLEALKLLFFFYVRLPVDDKRAYAWGNEWNNETRSHNGAISAYTHPSRSCGIRKTGETRYPRALFFIPKNEFSLWRSNSTLPRIRRPTGLAKPRKYLLRASVFFLAAVCPAAPVTRGEEASSQRITNKGRVCCDSRWETRLWGAETGGWTRLVVRAEEIANWLEQFLCGRGSCSFNSRNFCNLKLLLFLLMSTWMKINVECLSKISLTNLIDLYK